MRYFYTPRVERIVIMSQMVLITVALAFFVLRGSVLVFVVGFLPLYLLNFYLRDHKPPFKGERRWRHVNHYQRIEWNGKEWADVDE